MKSPVELRRLAAEKFGEAEKLAETKSDEVTGLLAEADQASFDGLIKLANDMNAQAERLDALQHRPAISGIRDRSEDKPFANMGEFLRAVFLAATTGTRDVRLATGASEAVPSEGGFLVQKDFAAEIFRIAHETGEILKRVRKTKISANSNGLKINAIDESSRVTGSRFGGVRAYWLGEGDAKTASKPKFRQMELTLKKLAALFYATDELLEDTTALTGIVDEALREEIIFLTEDSFLHGNGANKPLGIMNSGAVISVAKESGQAADTIKYENLVKMWGRLWSRSKKNAVWLMNQDVAPALNLMTLTGGTASTPVYLPPGGASAAPYGMLFGRPIVEVEYLPTIGDLGDVLLADLSQYIMIDKGGIQTAQSMHVQFVTDETVFRFVYRVDGQPLWNLPLTPFAGTNTVSPFVTLDARA